MDIWHVIGAFGGGSLILSIGIMIGSRKSIGKDIDAVDHKVRNLQHWRDALPTQLDVIYARKDTIAAELLAIKESVARIERGLEIMRGDSQA